MKMGGYTLLLCVSALALTIRMGLSHGDEYHEPDTFMPLAHRQAIWIYYGVCILITYSICCLLIAFRDWPPIQTKNISLICFMGFFVLPYVALTCVRDGGVPFERPPGHWLREYCKYIYLLGAWGGFVTVTVPFIRLYRYYKIFILKRPKMFHPAVQTLLVVLALGVTSIQAVMVVFSGKGPEENGIGFEEDLGTCRNQNRSTAYPLYLGVAVIIFADAFLAFRLRGIRAQFNEYKTVRFILNLQVVQVILLLLPNVFRSGQTGFYFSLVSQSFSATLFVIGLGGPPVYYRLTRNNDYLYKYTYGFSTLPTPEILKASLADQLTSAQVREKFKAFSGKRFAQENVEFYEAVMARESIEDWFERQAQTMEIIDTYIRQGAPREVNIDDVTRQNILKQDDINRPDLFNEAKRVILKVMETDLEAGFQESDEFKAVKKAAEDEQAEIAALAAAGLVNTRSISQLKGREGGASQSIDRPAGATDPLLDE